MRNTNTCSRTDYLSEGLTIEFCKGYSKRNIEQMRQFFLSYSIPQTMSAQLNAVTQTQKSDAIKPQTLSAVFGQSWSHYLILMRISNNDERKFYEIECSKNNWSVRELQGQLNFELYRRLTLSRDKNKVRELSEKGLIVEHPKDAI